MGTLSCSICVLQIRKLLHDEGIFTLRAIPMGGNMVLILVLRVRSVRVRVSRIPVHAWSEDFFKLLAQLVWSFIDPDEATRNRARFDVGRLLISTPSPEANNKIVNIKVNDIVFSVRLIEEVLANPMVGSCSGLKENSFHDNSSENSDSFVESHHDLPDFEVGGVVREELLQRWDVEFSNSKWGSDMGFSRNIERCASKVPGSFASPNSKYEGAFNVSV